MSRETLQAEIESARASGAYQNYLQVRERVLEMLEEARGRSADPSAFWEDQVASLGFMLDASPLVIRHLREHCTDITGTKAVEYRGHRQRFTDRVKGTLAGMKTADKDNLFVPESPELGGFGCLIDGSLVNADTLKYYECLIDMSNAGVLAQFRAPTEIGDEDGRKIVLEIGPGWGGLAYQFKTLFPSVTFVLGSVDISS